MRQYILLLVLASCDRPSPLGTFTRDDLSKWEGDCEAQIIEENPHEPRAMAPWSRDGRPTFVRATRRFRCPPPGWAIYTDKRDRVIGFCVDDDTNSRKNHGVWISALDRARSLITTHWGASRAGEMLKGATGDKCALRSEPVPGGMVRWEMWQLRYPNPETIYSHTMCCWEVEE